MMDSNSKIYVAGHSGLVGSAIVRELGRHGFDNLVWRTHGELDLTKPEAVSEFFNLEKPDYVFLAAAKVGGILANSTHSAEFFYANSMIQNNVIHEAYKHDVKKLLFLGSSCIYPRLCPQPIREEYLLSDYLEETNEAYAIAKIAGLKMCQYYNQQYGTNFISCMPTNLYGPNDNFDLESSHVLPALLRKFHEAKQNGATFVEIWGTGAPLREFMYVDDMADACVFLMRQFDVMDGERTLQTHVNIGTGEEITIRQLALLLAEIVGYEGEIHFNTDRPDGTPRKLLDVHKLNRLGWKHSTSLREGVTATYRWYQEEHR